MKTIYHICLEPLDNRYTKQWYTNIPEIINAAIKENELDMQVVTIDGQTLEDKTTDGAFLNFSSTNYYKAIQTAEISKLFHNGTIKAGDKFLFTDAWHFGITATKYMSELLDIPVEIHSIWHAGAYDPTDILGMKMSKEWPAHQERAWFHCSDFNYFGTIFHKQMFLRNLNIFEYEKAIRSGQPHTPIIAEVSKWNAPKKTNAILWPHRYNSDKQPEIAEDLAKNFQIIVTQKLNLSKPMYYHLLGKAKAVFSCSLHENLGISMMEGCIAGAIPIVPDRASYSEMYLDIFKYPSEWTSSVDNYYHYKTKLIDFINDLIVQYNKIAENELVDQVGILKRKYLSPTIMVNKLIGK